MLSQQQFPGMENAGGPAPVHGPPEPHPDPWATAADRYSARRERGEVTLHRGRQVPVKKPWDRNPDKGADQQGMFMPTSEVIRKVHKIDSTYCSGGTDTCYGDPEWEWEDVRDGKLMGATMKHMDFSVDAPTEHLAPLRIQHMDDFRGENPQLWDGHHRLATFEEAGHSEVPVWHSWDVTEKDPYTRGGWRWNRQDRPF